MYRMILNKVGLTFAQWFRTANFGRKVPLRADLARDAWKRGDDPTDYSVV